MDRRVLIILSVTGFVVSMGLWTVSYWNISYATSNDIFWLWAGCLSWSRIDMTTNNPQVAAFPKEMPDLHQRWQALEAEYERFQLSRENSLFYLKLIAQREQELLSMRRPGSWGVGGFQGLQTNWMPKWSRDSVLQRVRLPCWIPTSGFAFGAAFLLAPYFRRRRGFCRRCGYDLRGSPNMCPECGRMPNA